MCIPPSNVKSMYIFIIKEVKGKLKIRFYLLCRSMYFEYLLGGINAKKKKCVEYRVWDNDELMH